MELFVMFCCLFFAITKVEGGSNTKGTILFLNKCRSICLNFPVIACYVEIQDQTAFEDASIKCDQNQKVLSQEESENVPENLKNGEENQQERCKAEANKMKLQMYDSRLTWTEAAKECRRKGGQLVVISCLEKQQKVESYMSTYANSETWIGFRDYEKNNVYLWVDKSRVEYTVWDEVEPSYTYLGEDEDCGSIKRGKWWNDCNCDDRKPFLCETRG